MYFIRCFSVQYRCIFLRVLPYFDESVGRVKIQTTRKNMYMLLAGWEVCIVKNCDRGLENAARGRRPRAVFSGLRSQFFAIRTDPKPDNNTFIFFSWLTRRLQTIRKKI